MIPTDWLKEAQQRISPHIQKTPLTYDAKKNLYFKWENRQLTGSFKARGAFNKVLSLQPWEIARGLVSASAGNHGLGVAFAAKIVNARVTVFVSESAVRSKVEAIRAAGATIKVVPGGYGEAEKAGLDYTSTNQATWISPYNDGQVIAGQGTLGLEILKDLPELDQVTWVVPVGGGGLISGIGASLKSEAPVPWHNFVQKARMVRLVGVQSESSPFMHNYFYTGSQADTLEFPSLADGLSGPVEENSLTISLARNYVDEMVLVSETEITQAIAFAWHCYHERIEGSAATALAAVLFGKVTTRPVVVVISGGNIQPEVHDEIITKWTQI